jgi:hypothetical protein
MPYTWYYTNVPGGAPLGSRATAMVYPGAVCPTTADFGRTHGTAPARATVEFKGAFLTNAGQEVTIQIGQAVYYGIAIKGEITQSVVDGNKTVFSMVDLRDRLLDVNHYAQYNMVDNNGTWWHIYPNDWVNQIQTFVYDIQDIEDFRQDQDIADDINQLTDSPPMLSAMTLLKYFSSIADFTFSYTESAGRVLRTSYPENLDFNSGVKISECIQAVIGRYNMRFTAWGNLHLHITESGIADGDLERQIASGNVNLCLWRGYVDSSIGADLNENGRRIEITGGRDRYEYWYPAIADWNEAVWTMELCNDVGYELATLLSAAGVTRLGKLKDLPDRYRDDRKYNGISRNEMTIADYIDNVCFKIYRVDYFTPLVEDTSAAQDIQDGGRNFNDLSGVPFDWPLWSFDVGTRSNWAIDSKYPLSQNLCSDSNLQFYTKTHSRRINQKGIRDADIFLNGTIAYIMDGCSLNVEEYISTEDKGTNPLYCNKLYRTTVSFSERKYSGSMIREVVDGREFQRPVISSGKVFVRLATDRRLFTYTMGDNESTPRVRTIAKSFSDLRRNYIDGAEVALLLRNFVDAGLVSTVTADELAPEIATRELNHEYLTTAGHITFRTNAGFMPSGIIESIKVSFSARTGVREVINFTNIRNDDRLPNFFEKERRTLAKSDEEVERERQQAEAKNNLQFLFKQQDDGAIQPDPLRIANAFGNNGNAAQVIVDKDNMPELVPGDILVLHEAGSSS